MKRKLLFLLRLLSEPCLGTAECCFPKSWLHSKCEDGTDATPCCGYGTCAPGFPPCCGCDLGCRSVEVPHDCGEDVMFRSQSVACYIRYGSAGKNWSFCPGVRANTADDVIPQQAEDTKPDLNVSESFTVDEIFPDPVEIVMPDLNNSQPSTADDVAVQQPKEHVMPYFDPSQSRIDFYATSSDGFHVPRHQLLDLSYDFGPARVTVTAIGVGKGSQHTDQHYYVFSSDDGRHWDSEGAYLGRDGDIRLDGGRVTARYFRLIWAGGRGPIVTWLVGCAADPDGEVRHGAEAVQALEATFRWMTVSIAILVVCCCLLCSGLGFMRCKRCNRLPWKGWRFGASASVATTAPLLELGESIIREDVGSLNGRQ